jgi:hypothetical protein
MTIAYWITAGLLAFLYLAAGGMKLGRPAAALASAGMGWAVDFPTVTVKLVGVVEVLGAIGVVLPMALNYAPVLSPVAALGLVAVQVGAVITHLARHETKAIGMNIGLLLLALAVAILGFNILP